jgi:protocatechuate 3,4-dioxygenase beta subunit
MHSRSTSRRGLLRALGFGGVFYTERGLFAQTLTQTPAQTLGPYYPDRMPLDQDNDLIRINDNLTPAIGQVSWLSGRVIGRNGLPLRNALVEIWQADNNGAYIHSASPIRNRDGNFQGYGRFVTGSSGSYVFRTVKPGLYPGRTRHIHAQVTTATGEKLVTQLYIEGDPLNTNDGVLNGIRDAAQRASVLRPWTPIADSPAGELAVQWDIILGLTPADPQDGKPEILTQNGVVNGAGFQAGVTPGAWLTIYGDDLAATTRTWNAQTEIANGTLPTSLDGVSVSINGKPAAVYYISPSQINVQAPSDLTSGRVEVVVRNANGTSNTVTTEVQPVMPGFFLFDRYYVAANRADGSFVGPAGLMQGVTTKPAQPGETITIYGTGFGPTTQNVVSGEVFQGATPLTNPIEIRVGSSYAEVRFAGLTGAGLYQFNIVVPQIGDGDHDVRATIAGVRTQPLARLRVQRA